MSDPRSHRTLARPFGLVGLLAGALVVLALGVWANLTTGVDPSQPSSSALAAEPSTKVSDGPASSLGAPPTGPAQTPAGDAPWAEPNVVDRPGVPAQLYNKYWHALGEAGQVGTTARIVIPRTEEILAADAGLVASYAVVRDDALGTSEIVVGPDGVIIIVRDIRTGAVLHMVQTSVAVRSGVMRGTLLFWTGDTLSVDGAGGSDAGIWAVDTADPASTPRAIVEPSDLKAEYGPNATRSRLRLGDRGQAVLSTIVGDAARATQVIDVASLSLRTTIPGETAFDIADQTALVRRAEGVVLLDISSGQTVGPVLKATEVYRAFATTEEIFVQYGPGDGQGVYITGLAIETGDSRQILHQPRGVRTTDLSVDLSALDLFVLLDDDWDYGSDGGAYVQVTLLDPMTGELQPDAFSVGNP